MDTSRKARTILLAAAVVVAAAGMGIIARTQLGGARSSAEASDTWSTQWIRPTQSQPVASVPVELVSPLPTARSTSANRSLTAPHGKEKSIGADDGQGRLVIRVEGLQELHEEALAEDGAAGPVEATLERVLEGAASRADMFTDTATVLDDEVTFEKVPIGSEFELVIFYGDAVNRSQVNTRVTGPRTGRETRVDLDFASKKRNESAAIATLRAIAAAQQQLQASAAIDTDADGGGEHGYFGELAGIDTVRQYNGGSPNTAGFILDPPYLPKAFGNVIADGAGDGVVERQGYYFKMFLPDIHVGNAVRGIAELETGGSPAYLPDASNCEIMWCCYAWPVEEKTPRHGAFLISQDADVTETAGSGGHRYIGALNPPPFDAGFSEAGNMGSQPALAGAGVFAVDGNTWNPVGN